MSNIEKPNVISDLVVLIFITIPIFIFIWGCLILVWQHVTFLWIINEKLIILKTNAIFDFVMLILIIIPIFIFIWGCLSLVWQLVILLWIINVDFVNIDNEWHIWPCHVGINQHTHFHLNLRLFGTSLTTSHFSMNN